MIMNPETSYSAEQELEISEGSKNSFMSKILKQRTSDRVDSTKRLATSADLNYADKHRSETIDVKRP